MKSLLQIVNETYQYNTEKSSEVDTKLTITKEMLRQASGNKMHIIAKIHPQDFLKLTTSANTTIDDIKKRCRSVDDYNQWADEGETIIMPALWVRNDTVVGHEGRHRAAALICAGHDEMPVSIRLYPEKEHQKKYGYWDAEYRMRFEDMPEALHGQYGKGIVLKSDISVVINGWNNIKPAQWAITNTNTDSGASKPKDLTGASKPKDLTEAQYAGGQPALLTVTYAQDHYTKVYGPFKNLNEAEKFEKQMYDKFDEAGLDDDALSEIIYESNASEPEPIDKLIEEIKQIIKWNA